MSAFFAGLLLGVSLIVLAVFVWSLCAATALSYRDDEERRKEWAERDRWLS